MGLVDVVQSASTVPKIVRQGHGPLGWASAASSARLFDSRRSGYQTRVGLPLQRIIHHLVHAGKPPVGPALSPMLRLGVHRGSTARFPRFAWVPQT